MAAISTTAEGQGGRPLRPDFSLVLGGPVFQLLRRARLSDDALGLLHRRLAFAVLVTWAPSVALAALQGLLLRSGPGVPLGEDIGFHVRFLAVAPLLIIAEWVVHKRMRPIVEQFELRGLVSAPDRARYADALSEAARWRNSIAAEAALLAFVLIVGEAFTFRRYLRLETAGWYASPSGHGLSLAGLWLVFVSLPLLQFLLLRWYYRLLIWGRLLWRISRLRLDLNVTHPDKAGGLGFLSDSLLAFIPIAAAHGALFAGMMADRIFFGRARLPEFQLEVLAGAALLVLVFAGPLAVFGPTLAREKRAGLLQYGAVGQAYVGAFRDKWIRGGAPADEPLIGSGDIQSLADLGNSFAGAEQMRIVPIRYTALGAFVVAFLAPIAPLALTMMSVEKLIGQLVGLVF
jgi:hypothetical protein